jgi:VRR-NUC domain
VPIIPLLKRGNVSEEAIQKALVQWVNLNPYLARFVLHVPNEGQRSKSYGRKLKDLGMRKGAWDLLVTMARHDYIGAWIELKSQFGKLTPEQVIFGQDMREQGYFTAVCHSIDEAIHMLEWYCFDNKNPALTKLNNQNGIWSLNVS